MSLALKPTAYFFIMMTLLLSLQGAFATAEESLPPEITIGFTPGGDIEQIKKGATALAQQLGQELGLRVSVLVTKNYSALGEAMKNKKVDYAFFSAMTYVSSEDSAHAKVLLKKVWNSPFYYSVILVKKDSPIKKLADLKHKKLALVDEKSTSGYLYPEAMIKQKKLNGIDIVMSGSHAASVAQLEKGQVDAIAVFSDDKLAQKSAWTKYASLPGAAKKYRLLWISEPIPNDPFCVRQDFYDKYPKLTHTLMFALIDIAEKSSDQSEIKEVLGAQSFLLATSRQYDSVREVVKLLDLKNA